MNWQICYEIKSFKKKMKLDKSKPTCPSSIDIERLRKRWTMSMPIWWRWTTIMAMGRRLVAMWLILHLRWQKLRKSRMRPLLLGRVVVRLWVTIVTIIAMSRRNLGYGLVPQIMRVKRSCWWTLLVHVNHCYLLICKVIF